MVADGGGVMGWIRQRIANAFMRCAADIEAEHRGPHQDGTLGAMWCQFATNLRTLARQIGGS